MKLLACTSAVALLTLSACAQTPPPPDVRSEGKRISGTSRLVPLQLAMCMTRNVESGGLMATTRPGSAVGHLEMLAFTLEQGGMNVIAAADIRPAGAGSTYTMNVTPKAVSPEGLAGAMVEDC